MYLVNQNAHSFFLSRHQWQWILTIGLMHGWKPMGTTPNRDYLKKRARNPDGGFDRKMVEYEIERWNGSYIQNERQMVSWADALNLSFALEEAFKEGEWESGSTVHSFILFCKRGGFSIE